MMEPVQDAIKTVDQAIQSGSAKLGTRITRLVSPIEETLQPTRAAVDNVLESGDPTQISKLYSEGGMDRLAVLQKNGALTADEARTLNQQLAQRVNQNVQAGARDTINQFEAETGVQVKSTTLGDSGSSASASGNPKIKTDFDTTHTTNFDRDDLADYAMKRSLERGKLMNLQEANAELQEKFGQQLTDNVDNHLRADGFSRGVKDVDFKTYNGIGKGAGPSDTYPPGFTNNRMAVQGKGTILEVGDDGTITSHNISGQGVVDQHGLNQQSMGLTDNLQAPEKFGASEFKDFSAQQVKSVTEHSDVKSLAKAMGRENDLSQRLNQMASAPKVEGAPDYAGQLNDAGLPNSPPKLDTKLVDISKEINSNPSEAAKILKANGFDESSYTQAVRDNVCQYHSAIGGKIGN